MSEEQNEEPTLDDRREAIGKRVAALGKVGISIDFTPPRVDMLTRQVFDEEWSTREEFEAAWVERCEEIVTDVEGQVNRAKLLSGKAAPTQLSLVTS